MREAVSSRGVSAPRPPRFSHTASTPTNARPAPVTPGRDARNVLWTGPLCTRRVMATTAPRWIARVRSLLGRQCALAAEHGRRSGRPRSSFELAIHSRCSTRRLLLTEHPPRAFSQNPSSPSTCRRLPHSSSAPLGGGEGLARLRRRGSSTSGTPQGFHFDQRRASRHGALLQCRFSHGGQARDGASGFLSPRTAATGRGRSCWPSRTRGPGLRRGDWLVKRPCTGPARGTALWWTFSLRGPQLRRP